jgi:IS5 family transposase
MLRERYTPMNLFDLVPALRLALDPVLTQLETLLDDAPLFQPVKADMARRRPRTLLDGRPSTPVEVILRRLVVKHLYGWSYEATERWVSDSLGLRQFCRVYAEAVPDDTTLLRWANLIQPATLHRRLDHVVALARSLKVTHGRKLRMDGTGVATNIHHPTDSPLLYEAVRGLSRTLGTAKSVVPKAGALPRHAFRERTRSAQRQMKRLREAARQRGTEAADRMHPAYQHLLDIAQATVQQAQQVGAVLHAQGTPRGTKLATTLAHVVPLVCQVILQTTRRSLPGEAVPASEKVVSLFEPHTAIIRPGKPGKPTEFGRGLWWDEVEGGIISRYAVLEGHPPEDAQLPPSLDHHQRVFHRPPRLRAGERGIHSTANERYATMQGVTQGVLPQPGATSAKRLAHEQQRWFRRGRDGRAGLEGRISGLKRRYRLDRCRYHGTAGMARWVGWGVMAHNLRGIAQATATEPARPVPKRGDAPIYCQILERHNASKKVLHRNLGLVLGHD